MRLVFEDDDLDKLAERFCHAPLPSTVCSDPCVSKFNYPYPRSGTNLLSVAEAKEVLRYVLDIHDRSD